MNREVGKRKTVYKRYVAKTLLDVLRSTGKLTFVEAHEITHPNQSKASHQANAVRDLCKPEFMAEFYKLLRMDDKAIAKFGPKDLVTNILNDMHQFDTLMQAPDLSIEEFAKLQNAKTAKQKMMGSIHGIFNAEKLPDKEETDPDKLWDQGKQRYSLS